MKSVLNSVDNGAAFMEHIAGEVTTIATCWRIDQQPAKGVVVQAGTAQAGTARTLTLNASAVTLNDNYAGYTATLNSGAGAGQSRNVVSSRVNKHINSENMHVSWGASGTVSQVASPLLLDGKPASRFNMATGSVLGYIYDNHHPLAVVGQPHVRSFNIDVSGLNSPVTIIDERSQVYFNWTSPTTISITGNAAYGSYEILGDYKARLRVSEPSATVAANTLYIGTYGYHTFAAGEYFDINCASWQVGTIETPYVKTLGTEAVGIAVDTPWSSNLLTYSQQFDNAAWVKSNTTITANSAIAPDGANTADLCIPNNGVCVGGATCYQLTSMFIGVTYTYSAFVKGGGGIFNSIAIFDSRLGGGWATFTLAGAGSYVITGTGLAASIIAVGLFYRITLTGVSNATSSNSLVFYMGQVTAISGDGVSGVYLWGAQLDVGAVATPYIATTTTPVSPPDATSSYEITPTTKTVCFTNASQDITYQGLVYESSLGADPSSINSTAQLNVDNLNITGSLVAPAITHVDLDNGLWDYARVLVFAVNYADLTMGHMILRSGYLGQTTTGRTIYDAEIRGLTQALQQDQGRLCEERCDAAFGDSRCGVTKASYTFAGTVTSVSDGRTFGISLTQADTYFTGGELIFASGLNRGAVFGIRTSTVGNVVLYETANHQIAVGDSILVVAGCDKLRTTCFTKYNNVINHRGFPDIPGVDKMISGT